MPFLLSQSLLHFFVLDRCVDIKLIKKLKRPVTLKEIKEHPKLQNMRLVQRGNRLSVMPIEKKEFDLILKLSEK